jgi:hypothetical protein
MSDIFLIPYAKTNNADSSSRRRTGLVLGLMPGGGGAVETLQIQVVEIFIEDCNEIT